MNRLIAIVTFAVLFGCSAQREPGPGERIGRALDEMRKGFDELAPAESPEERRAREDREWRRRQDEYYRSHPRAKSSDTGYSDNDRSVDLYRDTPEEEAERAERDREFWSRPAPPREESDRY